MKTHELIDNLKLIDPSGEKEVQLYISLLYGGYQAPVTTVRLFTNGGDVMVTDEPDRR